MRTEQKQKSDEQIAIELKMTTAILEAQRLRSQLGSVWVNGVRIVDDAVKSVLGSTVSDQPATNEVKG